MNVLMFTMTMLMLLATMTYARLNHFRTFQISEVSFERYMNKGEYDYLLEQAENIYSVVVNPQNPNPDPKEKRLKTGTTKLSWSIFLDKDEREKNPAKFKEVSDLSRKLIMGLFKNSNTVQKMMTDSPDIIDRFFLSLITESEKLTQKMKIKDALHLSNLDLIDNELNLLRYELFKDNINSEEPDKTYSLLDHLTVAPLKTRIFLASPTLLKAIFNQDENIVNQIKEKRQMLYREVKNKHLENAGATAEFNDFLKNLCPYLNDNLFDYTVTKTDPKKYE